MQLDSDDAPDFMSRAARRHCGFGDDWRWCIAENPENTEHVILDMAKPIGFFAKGPRKGRPKYGPRKDFRRCVITMEQIRSEEAFYEKETGRCKRCYGSGETTAGWSKTTGVRKVACLRCAGTGKVPPPVAETTAA